MEAKHIVILFILTLLGVASAVSTLTTIKKAEGLFTHLSTAAPSGDITTVTLFMTWNTSATQGLLLLESPAPTYGQYLISPPQNIYPYMSGVINTAWMIANKNGSIEGNCTYAVTTGGSLSGSAFIGYSGNAKDGYGLGV